MKFTWKIIFIVSVLLALSLAVSGYAVVQQTLSARLERESRQSQEDMKLFGMTLQALTLGAADSVQEQHPSAIILQILRSTPALQTDAYGLWDAQGELLSKSELLPGTLAFLPQSDTIETRFVIFAGKTLLISAQVLPVQGEQFYIARARDVSAVFDEAQAHLSNYQLIMALVLTAGIVLITLATLVLTGPIRRISATAKQLAQGRYHKRVKLTTKDELGRLAQDFNAMADSLEAKIAELAEALARQKEFTAAFAHELKTPLTSVIGYADTLRSRVLPPQAQLQASNYIFHEGKRLEAMSHALLDLFALEGSEPVYKAVSICAVVREAVRSCAYLLERDGIRIEQALAQATLLLEPELIKTLLCNLIDNARKASSPGGKILIAGKQLPHGYALCVQDFGRGIAPEALARITEPFYMVDKSRSRAQGGAGLGLALCKKIAQAHHSALHFESTPGAGTCVSVLLGGRAK